MKRSLLVCLFLCLTATFLLSQATAKTQAGTSDHYGKLPLSFEANRGQSDAKVKFLSRNGGYTLFLTGDEAVLALRAKPTDDPKTNNPGAVLRMKLHNANPAAKVTGIDQLAGTSNYFRI
jgi:hypothetical protein